jgi:hypothetical protein
MQKPINKEIAEAMGKRSELSALYGSLIKWDWLRRQKIEDIGSDLELSNCCALCKRNGQGIYTSTDCGKCILGKKQKGGCGKNERLYSNVWGAFHCNDQQAFTQNANDLYLLLWKLIEEQYAPKPPEKKEVFYHKNQRFLRKSNDDVYRLCLVENYKMNLICEDDATCWSKPVRVSNANEISKAEFTEICNGGTFTLIE